MEKTDVRMYEVGVLPGRNHILHTVRKGSRHSYHFNIGPIQACVVRPLNKTKPPSARLHYGGLKSFVKIFTYPTIMDIFD
jgi:hypothetical protein